jgi:hypothetical protein
MQVMTLRAGRKRAPIMKALEAEKAPKRGTDRLRHGPGPPGRAGPGPVFSPVRSLVFISPDRNGPGLQCQRPAREPAGLPRAR